MQKLLERNTYRPIGASQADRNSDLVLNRDDSLSVPNLKTSNNNPEENLRQHKGGSNLRVLNIVYVLNQKCKNISI